MSSSGAGYIASSSMEAVRHTMELTTKVLGFDIVELWTQSQDEDEGVYCVYIHSTDSIARMYPGLVLGAHPVQRRDLNRVHKLSPLLCDLARQSPRRCHWRTMPLNGSVGEGRFSPLNPDLQAPCCTEVAYMLETPELRDSNFLVAYSLHIISFQESKLKFLSGIGYAIFIAACGFDDDEEGRILSKELDNKSRHRTSTTTHSKQNLTLGFGNMSLGAASSTNSNIYWHEASTGSSSTLRRRRGPTFDREVGSTFDRSTIDRSGGLAGGGGTGPHNSIVGSLSIVKRDSHESDLMVDEIAPAWNPVHPFTFPIASLPLSVNAIDDLSLSNFTNVKHVADGSNSNVFLATFKSERVVIKMIKEEYQYDAVVVHEFDVEQGILSRLQHPNIIQLKGSGRLPRRFIVLEYMDGGSLSTTLMQNQSKPGLAQRLFRRPTFTYAVLLEKTRDIANAFEYLHSGVSEVATIIHRDLKPDNVGFSADGTLKLFDFGLCTCVKRRETLGQTYKMTGNTGSLRYMAPEVALRKAYTESVDVYSFGILAWQMARDRVPFKGLNKDLFMRNVVAGGQRPKLDKSWPVAFSSLIQSCWHDDPNQRPTFTFIFAKLTELLDEEKRKNGTWSRRQLSMNPAGGSPKKASVSESSWF